MEQPYQIDKYPIKCGDCNDLVDCYVDDFLELVAKGLTKAEALDNMGIFRPCTRIRFFNPSKIPLMMENRKVIEGLLEVNPMLEPDKEVTESEGVNLGIVIKAPRLLEPDMFIEDLESEYEYPTIIGIPTVNRQDFPDSKYMRYCGAGKYSQILSGCKYLAN